MAPKLKLTYFPLPGRAEKVRLAFVLGGVAFEDVLAEAQRVPKLPRRPRDADRLQKLVALCQRPRAIVLGVTLQVGRERVAVRLRLVAHSRRWRPHELAAARHPPLPIEAVALDRTQLAQDARLRRQLGQGRGVPRRG